MVWMLHEVEINDPYGNEKYHEIYLYKNREDAIQRIMDETSLNINRLASGPLGGDQQIGSLIVSQDIDLVIFLRDPHTSQAHEPDIQALIRLCDVYHVPIATNLASAEIFINALNRGELSWREVRKTSTQRV